MDTLKKTKEQLLREWIAEHQNLVYRTAYFYVKDASIAEDIAQEVFLRAYKHMDEFRGDAKVSTWLYRITSNACKDYLRSWSHRKLVVTHLFSPEKTSESAEQEVLRSLEEDELLRHVIRLPLKYREVIVLYYFEQLKSREIAELLDTKESTIRVRISRGLEKLKKALTGGDEQWETSTNF